MKYYHVPSEIRNASKNDLIITVMTYLEELEILRNKYSEQSKNYIRRDIDCSNLEKELEVYKKALYEACEDLAWENGGLNNIQKIVDEMLERVRKAREE